MTADLELECVDCNELFWWPASEQVDSSGRKLLARKRCPECRAIRKRRIARETDSLSQSSTSLVRNRVAESVAKLPAQAPGVFEDKAALFADIQQLLKDASVPIIKRDQTFLEWINSIDPIAKQLADKMSAARTADDLVQQRTALLDHVQQMLTSATNAELTRIQAEIRLRQAQVQMARLDDEIEEIEGKRSLAGPRLETNRLKEQVNQTKLRDAVREKPDERRQVIEQHRQHLRSTAEARQGVLSDFLREVEAVCDSDCRVHEKALRIREVLSAFERDDDSLPEDARLVLRAAERLKRG